MKKLLAFVFWIVFVLTSYSQSGVLYGPGGLRIGSATNLTPVFRIGVTDITTTPAQFNYSNTVTSNIQTQFTGKVGTADTATMLTKYARKASPTFTGTHATTGGIVDLNVSSNYATNINSGTSTGTVTVGGTGIMAIDIGANTGVKTISVGTHATPINVIHIGGTNSLITGYGTWALPSTTSIGNVSSTELGYVDGVTSAIQTQIGTKSDTSKSYVYSYVLDKRGGTIYAKPAPGLTAYSNADLATVFNQAIAALTSGGSIYVRKSVVDSVRSTIGTVNTDLNNIDLIFEAGSRLIAKKNLMYAGSTVYTASMFLLENVDNWTITGLVADGNSANQTFTASVDQSAIFLSATNNVLINRVNISNMRIFGVTIANASTSSGVINSIITTCGWNGITLGNHNTCTNLFAINNEISHCGDVGISCIGTSGKVIDNYLHSMDGVLGDVNGNWCLAVEYVEASNHNIFRGNRCVGGKTQIDISANNLYNIVEGNYFINCAFTAPTTGGAIQDRGSYNIIRNNYVYATDTEVYGILPGHYAMVQGNFIDVDNHGIFTNDYDYILIENNRIDSFNEYSIRILSGSVNTRVIGNDWDASSFNPLDEGTNTFYANNILADGHYGTNQKAVTATSDGLTTGILVTTNQNITVTSANAAYIVCLPAAGATVVGSKLTGSVGANGFELRVQAAQATTVYINNVTTNVEAVIPATSTFEVECIDATHWILHVWDAVGAVSQPIPDAV